MTSIPGEAPFLRVVPTLRKFRKTAGGFVACCPAHDDGEPSLSGRVGDDGRVLMRCHAGCSAEAIVGAVGMTLADLYPPHPNGNGKPHRPHKPPSDWPARAADFVKGLSPERRHDLAEALGLPEAALAALPLLGHSARGFHPDRFAEPCWTFPEVDAAGAVIGINCRYRDGAKMRMAGGESGLTVPDGWRDRGGSVLLPEGPSDTLTLTALGLSAVGRPNNVGGVPLLAELLRGIDRPIVVVGEYDPKPTGRWPGRDGAQKTAAELRALLGRPVAWVLPPAGAKDVRAWAAAQRLPPDCADSWAEAGERLLAAWEGKYIDARPAEAAAPRFAFAPVDAVELAARARPPEWLVKRVMVANQNGVVGGPKKALKTSMLVALFVALATGRPFLGTFAVPRQRRVCLVSVESGEFVILETLRRVCAAQGVTIEDTRPNLTFEFRLPRFGVAGEVDEVGRVLADLGVEVAAFDPLYLCALAGVDESGPQASNAMQMGPLYAGIGDRMLSFGCTPLLAHHFKQGRPEKTAQPDLGDLSHAGIQEYAAQWLLLSRREPFQPGSGLHHLWLVAGGRVGHSGCWGVDVDEGQLGEDFGGRKWETSVMSEADAIAAKDDRKASQREAKGRADETSLLSALDRMGDRGERATLRALREVLGWGHDRALKAASRLVKDGILETVKLSVPSGSGATRLADVYRRANPDG